MFDIGEFEKRLRETELQSLEDYKAGRVDAPVLYKAIISDRPEEKTDGLTTVVASEQSEDRYGDIILVDGWELSNFKRNPVFLFTHNHAIAPIGTVPKVWPDGKQLLASVEWDDLDEFAAFIHGKYDREVMRAVSVGFRALEFENREKGVEFKRQELLELSAVPIPAHPAALQKAMGIQKFHIVVPELTPVEPIEPIQTEEEECPECAEREMEEAAMVDKAGVAVSRANREKLGRAIGLIREVIGSEKPEEPEPAKEVEDDIDPEDLSAVREALADLRKTKTEETDE